jgi:hypothetical protein
MLRILGWSLLVALGSALLVNGLFMLVSPPLWFRLPNWIRAQGSLTQKKYGTGWGAAQVRLTGAWWVAVVVWVLYESLLKRR